MRIVKLVLVIVLVLLAAYFVGGLIMSVFWILIKIMLGVMGLTLLVGGFYIGKNWRKNK